MRIATIANLEDRTSEDERTGAVRSIQAADLSLPQAALTELWSPIYLERLGPHLLALPRARDARSGARPLHRA